MVVNGFLIILIGIASLSAPVKGAEITKVTFDKVMKSLSRASTPPQFADFKTAVARYYPQSNMGVVETCAFLANAAHETGGFVYLVEQNRANYPHYCDMSQPYGCPAGMAAYFGRGWFQLSWNYNYKNAGDALRVDLLHNPDAVVKDKILAIATALWFWNTQKGASSMTCHEAMQNGKGFGETIRSIAGDIECNGKGTVEREDRIRLYNVCTQMAGVPAGNNLNC